MASLPPGAQHAPDLRQRPGPVAHVADAEPDGRAVDRRGAQRYPFGVGPQQPHRAARPAAGGLDLGQTQHLRREIDPDDASGPAPRRGEGQRQVRRAGAQIEDALAPLQPERVHCPGAPGAIPPRAQQMVQQVVAPGDRVEHARDLAGRPVERQRVGGVRRRGIRFARRAGPLSAGIERVRHAPSSRTPRLQSDGAAPRTPGVHLRGPLRPAPLPPRRAVRALRSLHGLRRRLLALQSSPPAPVAAQPTLARSLRRSAAQTPSRSRPDTARARSPARTGSCRP